MIDGKCKAVVDRMSYTVLDAEERKFAMLVSLVLSGASRDEECIKAAAKLGEKDEEKDPQLLHKGKTDS